MASSQPLVAQQRPAGYEEGIVAVVARDLPSLTLVVLADSSGQLLMPLIRIAEMVGMTASRPDSMHVMLARSDTGSTTIDLAAHTISGGGKTTHFTPAEVVAANGDVYMTVARIGEVLQATATFDMSTLTLMLSRDPLFPAQQLLAIEQRRALLVAHDRAMIPAPRIHVPFEPATGPGVLDWEISSNNIDPTRLVQLRARAGIAVWGGSLSVGGTTVAGRDSHDGNIGHDITARYHRVFPDARYLTQVEAGDIITAGLFARFLRGVQLTNAPQQRAYELGSILLRPDLPAGWQYEVLQNGRLLGFSDAVSRDAVAVPLHTGSSPVSVRLYGPGGQQVETTLLYQTPTALLPRGKFEYAVAGGTCAGDLCNRYMQADARYGRWTRATVGVGAEYIADSTGNALRPYAVSSFTTGTLLTGELQIMPDAVYRGTFAVYPRASSTGTLSIGLSEPGYGRVSVIPASRSRWDADALWDQRLDRQIGPLRSIRAGIGGTAQTDGAFGRTHFTLASSLSAGYAEIRWERSDVTPDIFSARISQLLENAWIPAPLRSLLPSGLRPLVDGGIGIDRRGASLIHGGIAIQHERVGALSTGFEWLRGNDRPRFTLSWARTFSGVQALARAVSDPQGFASSTLSLRGALSVSPNGDIATGPLAREGYGGIYGRVFLDRNGDGVFSAGDETVPGASLIVGETRVTSDEHGDFHAWSLLPYGMTPIHIDSTGESNPGWVTAQPRILARPVPNTSIRVDVALLETREVAGSISALPGVATVAGVTIELAPDDGGQIITSLTFSDGQFYISRVRPGRYRVRVARTSLEALHAVAEPADLLLIVPRTGDAAIDLPTIVLKPSGSGS